MAADIDMEIDSFLKDCEQRLSCHYVHPRCTDALPAATRVTRYLFPMSLHGLGVHPRNSVIELLLVANISPKTFWNEVEEAFEHTDYKVTILTNKFHPSSARRRPRKQSSFLLVETRGQVFLLEYHQTITPFEELVDIHGYVSQTTPSDPLIRVGTIQYLAMRDRHVFEGDSFRRAASTCMQLAYDGGILSERLELKTPQAMANVFAREKPHLTDKRTMQWASPSQLWAIAATTVIDGLSLEAAADCAPRSPRDGLQIFLGAHDFYLQIQVNYWGPASSLAFADAFFDVLTVVQDDVWKRQELTARVWPFHLMDRTVNDGAAVYFLGISTPMQSSAMKQECRAFLEKSFTAVQLYLTAQDVIGSQFGTGKYGQIDDYYISAIVTGRDDNSLNYSEDFLQRHVAPVRNLSHSTLRRLHGDPVDQAPEAHGQQQSTDDTATLPGSFRTGKMILDQLRWDPKYAGTRSYEVGYEDRFTAALLWLPIEDWVQTTEEEEFIPLHRIRQFRVTETKEVVWDRAKRMDKLK